MNSPTPINARFDQRHVSRTPPDAMPHIAAPFAEAANDGDFYRSPLWLVAGALALLFALLACLVVAG